MATVKEVFGEMPRMKVDLDSFVSLKVDPDLLWVNYDEVTDSIIMYITGEPTRSVAVALGDNIYAMVDPKTSQVVGFQFEAWEKVFIPAFKQATQTWNEVKPNLTSGWSYNLQTLVLWFVAMLQSHPKDKGILLNPS